MGSWWEYVQANPIVPNPSGVSRYTEGMDKYEISQWYCSNRRILVLNQGWAPIMRNLECDFSPHLLPDFHPGWGSLDPGWIGGSYFSDIFGSNPWYGHSTPLCVLADNRSLYHGQDWKPLDGTLNPPGSWVYDPNGVYGYLCPGSVSLFGPFGYVGSTNYSVNQCGYGDPAPGPDLIPDTANFQGIRFNCQVGIAASGNPPLGNLQTFLGINGVLPVDPEPEGCMAPATRYPASPTAENLKTALDQARNLIKK